MDMLEAGMEREEGEPLPGEAEEMSGSGTVTLDPGSASPFLLLAADGRGVRRGDEWSPVPDTAERFEPEPCVLGSPGFAAGRHCWAVEVAQGGQWWALGVAQESLRRKGVLSFTPQEGLWAVGQWFGQLFAFTDPDWTPLHLPCVPRAIQVCLDLADRTVAFADAETQAPIFTFCLDSHPGERLRPWLWLGKDSWLQLWP
ncbi:E3 ubiquitin-protein ligase TRIM15-like [Neopsephotus bourkii]|uniref:E3 ubiquitin-protein ligase TRIM15-like n=1 Tax=Neopsephotus bourkii TaxID=309878 RepID=UPI002AA57806|nr:E3 ubiquitin-protein ligase TRIM15-like [Neopsephotus bourkii]